jgi:hypothetical protein
MVHNEMVLDRCRFKYALRACKREEETIRADKLAASYQSHSPKEFWKEVKYQSCRKVPLAETVDGKTGNQEIARMWASHFSSLFNSTSCEAHKVSVLNSIENRLRSQAPNIVSDATITTREVADAIRGLSRGKSSGPDGLSAEHFLSAPGTLPCFLSMAFNCSVAHGYLPSVIMKSNIVPVIKDKAGDSSDKSNYRPIALCSILSKILEIVLLKKVSSFLTSSDHQFAFKSGHSTDLCIYVLKEIISHYLSHATPVFACFMDASKAFDKVNHWSLFDKLLSRNTPVLIVRLILFWYRGQASCVRWGDFVSDEFFVSNGVRQGGVLSPVLFNVYVDSLSQDLISTGIGCCIGKTNCNHLFYADDLVLLSPSEKGLQKLVDVAAQFGSSHELSFNVRKTNCMLFLPKKAKLLRSPNILLNGSALEFISKCKYLGVFISNDMCDDHDLTRQLRSFYMRSNYLARNFKACSPDVKTSLFTTFCGNMYAGHCWSSFSKATFSKLNVAFNNSFRCFMSYPRFCSASAMFVFNNVKSFSEIFRFSILNFRRRILCSSNSIIISLLFCTLNSSLWCHWANTLFSF